MRKLLLALSIPLAFLSCSKSNDDSSNNSNGSSNGDFHPPSWIQGTWAFSNGNYNPTKLFKFTVNDFISISQNTETSWQALLNQIKTTGGTASVTETITATKYDFIINYSAQSTNYSFTKIDNNSIKYNYQTPITLIRVQ